MNTLPSSFIVHLPDSDYRPSPRHWLLVNALRMNTVVAFEIFCIPTSTCSMPGLPLCIPKHALAVTLPPLWFFSIELPRQTSLLFPHMPMPVSLSLVAFQHLGVRRSYDLVSHSHHPPFVLIHSPRGCRGSQDCSAIIALSIDLLNS